MGACKLSGVALGDELAQLLMTEWDSSNVPASFEYFILFWKEHLTGDTQNLKCTIPYC